MPNCVPAVQNANRLAGLHYSVWGKVDFKNIVIKGFQHPISSWKICMGTLTAAQTTQPSTLASLLLPCTPLPACIKFRQVNGWGVEDKNGGEIGEYRVGGVGGIQRKRGTWKRSQSYLWRNEQEIVVWRIICGSSREQQEKSNPNLKGLMWREVIYQKMRAKVLSFLLSPRILPLGSRIVREGRRIAE